MFIGNWKVPLQLKRGPWAALAVLFLLIVLAACSRISAGDRVAVGHIDEFPPGSVILVEVRGSFEDPDPGGDGQGPSGTVTPLPPAEISPVRVFIVNTGNQELLALYDRDPHFGCRVTWVEEDRRFVNPCHGETYAQTGEWLSGPAPRGLDRFPVEVDSDGQVIVALDDFTLGPPH